MKIENTESETYNLTLSNYEMYLLHQILLAGQIYLSQENYNLTQVIKRDKDLQSIKDYYKISYTQTELETAANIMVDTISQSL